jgi:hypothetical protein
LARRLPALETLLRLPVLHEQRRHLADHISEGRLDIGRGDPRRAGADVPEGPGVLRVQGDGAEEQEEVAAREGALQAAQERIEALAVEWPDHLPLIDTLRAQYAHRASHVDDRGRLIDGRGPSQAPSAAEQELIEHRAIRQAVIEAERGAIIDLRDSGQISDDVWRRVERDLDLEELRMEA